MDKSIWDDIRAARLLKKEHETYLEFADRIFDSGLENYSNPQIKIAILRELLHVADGELAA